MKILSLRAQTGVTLVELLIVIAIVGVLVGLVAPNYTPLMGKITVATETRRTIGMLKKARNEARARGATVTLRRDANADWSGRVIIYESTTNAGNADYVEPDAGAVVGDDLISDYQASTRSISVKDNDNTAGARFISFSMQGWLASSELNPVRIAICSPVLDATDGMYVEVNRVGKIRERPILEADAGGVPVKKQLGVTLVEVLIALLVFAIGVGAMAGLQLRSLSMSVDATQRAVVLAKSQELADRIRGNSGNASLYVGQYSNAADAGGNSFCATKPATNCADSNDGAGVSCNGTAMVTFDLYDVLCRANTGMNARVVEWQTNIACAGGCNGPQDTITITTTWVSRTADTNADLAASQGSANDATQDQLTLSFIR